ncbi:hypothetical protein M3Y97_00229500 [Aphelenchoides bicaudatus]|nr:hypothetical protein M3Y97_00229500 [Aphelenchoides bicaudatus]
MSNVSDRNSNHQQPNLLIQNQMISNNAFLDTSTSQQFQYQSFQITQQPQMQSSNLFVDNQGFLPIVEEEDSNTPPPKKTRKPRKPRNANGTQNSKAKGRTASAEQSDLDLPSIQNQLDHQRNSTVAGAVYSEFSMTGQPYPTSMISNVMAFNPSFEYANLSSDQFTHSSQLPTIDEQDSTVRKKRQRKPRNNSRRSKSQEEDQLLIGMLNNQAAGSVQTTSGSTFANQSLSFDAGRSASTMSTSQVAYSMQTPINMQPMYNNAGPMNPMQMNGVPYQMNAMAAGQPSQVSWQNNGMMNSSQAPSEFHPMYQSQQNQIQMMYSQQQGGMGPTSLTQSSPVGKKPAAKRKSNQQLTSANNAPMQPNKQHFMPNGMPQNSMPNNINGMINAQHYQQFPQSNQMYNQQMMQHAPPMNQQQMIAQQQQMMANGINSPQFSSPATPISYGQKSSEAVRLELRNTLQTRQNANSPSSQPNSTQMPHSVQQNVMPMSNEINSRFPSSNEAAPNLLSPPRLSSNSQQQTFGGVQPSAQQNLFNMQQAQLMNRHSGIMAMEKNDYPFSDFDLDQKPPSLFQTQDDLLHNDNTYYDFALLSGRFDLSNLETKSLVEKLLG